ncbi:LuxR C-terminal-related transcriptional regulator [Streptomyces sp. NPDC058401]|uniref:LuxR C-terminal-related transcriptional regulator n=1 Tax=Streptomyces sp. NPDC058401 TaxID=3346480 RepID=UPI00366462B7
MSESLALDAGTLAVYRAVLLHHEHDSARLARRLSMTEPQVRACTDRLISLSLLRPSWEQPDSVRAVSPDLGLEMMLHHEQQELALRQERIAQTRATLSILASEYAANRTGPLPENTVVLQGIDQIRTRMETYASRCTEEALSFQPVGSLATEAIEAGQPLNEQAMLRGVKFRSLFLQSITKDRAGSDYVKWAGARGGEIRLAPTLPMRLLIVDRSVAVIPGDPATVEQPTAVVVQSPPVIRALHALFEAYWKDAAPWEDHAPVAGPPVGPTPQERAILRMLADGEKDVAIARALGVSIRTERRIVADITARLGVSGRFELGVRAAKLGWV